MADFLRVLERQCEALNAPQEPLTDERGATFQGEGVTEPIRDLLWCLTHKTRGIVELRTGRYAFVCGRHLIVRVEAMDPLDLAGFGCDECEAHAGAARYREAFRRVLAELRHG